MHRRILAAACALTCCEGIDTNPTLDFETDSTLIMSSILSAKVYCSVNVDH